MPYSSPTSSTVIFAPLSVSLSPKILPITLPELEVAEDVPPPRAALFSPDASSPHTPPQIGTSTSRPPAPPLVKSLSDSPGTTMTMTRLRAPQAIIHHRAVHHHRASSNSDSQEWRQQHRYFRRSSSASGAGDERVATSSGSAFNSFMQTSNRAGSSLRIPRRSSASTPGNSEAAASTSTSTSSSTMEMLENGETGEEDTIIGDLGQAEDGSVRGKGKGKTRGSRPDKRSMFVLGSDEEEQQRSSGSEDSQEKKEGKLNERQRRGRSVSTGRSTVIDDQQQSAAALLLKDHEFALDSDSEDGTSSGSECATPTPATISRGRHGQAKALDPASPSSTPKSTSLLVDHRRSASSPTQETLTSAVAASEDADGGEERVASNTSDSNIPGVAPRMRRGVRGPAARKARSGLAFDVDISGFAGDIEVQAVDERKYSSHINDQMNAGSTPSSSSSDAELGTPKASDCNDSGVKNDTSTIVFPSKQGAIIQDSSSFQPSPESDPTAELGSSFAGRRASALTLHLDLSRPSANGHTGTVPGDRPKEPLDPVADSSNNNDMRQVREEEARRVHYRRASSFVPSSATYCSPPPPSPSQAHVISPNGTGNEKRTSLPKIAVVTSTPSPPFSSKMSSSITMPAAMSLIRKKSGEIVKSSLKTRSKSVHSRHKPSLSLSDLASLPLGSPSLSAPASPSELPIPNGSVPNSLHSASSKIVHFASQLEQVKHFRTEQKPAAVSRDGSPTLEDTTSGGESGGEWSDGYFPSANKAGRQRKAPSSDEEAAIRKTLAMRVLNMPSAPAPHTSMDVWLEHLRLSDDASCVQGTVSVKNVAFEKQVVVRFTFDGWQTTSEVGARWKESCMPPSPPMVYSTPSLFAPNGLSSSVSAPLSTYDRFEFSIKLSDMLLRIDEKTLVLAIRFNAAGREMWDNNNGQNYRAVFERHTSTIGMSGPAVVQTKLENKGVDANKLHNALGLSLERRANSIAREEKGRGGEGASSILSPVATSKKPSDPLAMRYDLGTSLKNPSFGRPSIDHAQTWSGRGHSASAYFTPEAKLHDVHPPARHSYVPKKPTFTTHSLQFKTRPAVTGSPRDPDIEALGDQTARFGFAAVGSNNFVPSQHSLGIRRHRRTDYFDPLNAGGGFGYGNVRLTPPSSNAQLYGYGATAPQRSMSDADTPSAQSSKVGTPICEGAMSPSRCHSFPPLSGSVNSGMEVMANLPWSQSSLSSSETSSSEASTPSITSVSSPTLTPSPSSPPDFLSIPLFNIASDLTEPEQVLVGGSGYQTFVDNWCFYTGSSMPSDMRRSMSDSNIEGLFSSTPSMTATESFPVMKTSHSNSVTTTPTLPSGFGGMHHHGSGFSTPKAMSTFTSSPSFTSPIPG